MAAILLAGCEQTKSSNPLSPAIAGPIAGVTISQPTPIEPAPNAQIAVDQQPISLGVVNAATTGVRPLNYEFDIATDPGFASMLFTQNGVTPGANGQTIVQLPQSLPADHTYYWRARAQDGANTGTFAVANFAVFTPVLIQPPAPVSPADGSTVSSATPTLVVADATRTGPAGAISYVFEVATDGNMVNKVVAAQVAEGSGQTSYTLTAPLSASTRYFWHARAADPSHTSLFSATISFVTPAAAVSVPTPPSSPSAPIGSQTDTLTTATVLNSPLDLGSWPITTTITDLELRSTGVHVEFSKEDGPGRWPDVVPPGFSGPLEYTLGMCLNITAHWYCSAPIEFWNGLDASGGDPNGYAANWFYDPGRWGPMSGHQPAPGETIGFFVCEGDCRNNTAGSSSPLRERSNVVLVPMPTESGASFTFSGIRIVNRKK